jgi:hypothetical protein
MTDKLTRATHVARDAVNTTSHDIVNRTRGIAAATRARFASDDVSDAVLLERVRAKLGRVSSHPRAIDVSVSDGQVILNGQAPAHEVPHILAGVESVRGVSGIASSLDVHETAEAVPSLQGQGRVAGGRFNFLRSPAARGIAAAVALAGTGLLATGHRRRVSYH